MTDEHDTTVTMTGDHSRITMIAGRDVALLAALKAIAKELANPSPFPYLNALSGKTSPIDDAIAEFERAVTIPVHP